MFSGNVFLFERLVCAINVRNQCCSDDDDMTDDDLPVDMDILEQVCTGKKTLDPRPFNKTIFDPFGPVSKMKAV